MRALPVLSLLLALLALPAAARAMDVTVDFDSKADFSKIRTFAFKVPEDVKDPLMLRRVMDGIETRLKARGITRVEKDPDVFVSIFGTKREEVRVDTDTWGYRPGPYWRRYGALPPPATTTVHTYTIGTMVVDIWDARANELMWRGTASDTMVENPQKRAQKIDKALTKLFAKFPPAK